MDIKLWKSTKRLIWCLRRRLLCLLIRIARRLPLLCELIRIALEWIPSIAHIANYCATNSLASSTTPRPHSYSLWSPLALDKKESLLDKEESPCDREVENLPPPSDYLTWHTVTDKNYFDLHLGPAKCEFIKNLPSECDVINLFKRGNKMDEGRYEGRSSVFFMFFAQWFTDGFFRSSHKDPRKTTSNHNIDLAQIYGSTEEVALMLRSREGGKLRSQMIEGEEYPDYLGGLDGKGVWQVKEHYENLPYIADKKWMKKTFCGLDDQQKKHLLATGLDRGNLTVGNMVMNTLFLREHNSICDQLVEEYPKWDDDRLFHTARIINTVVLIKLVIEEYVNHIAGIDVLRMKPSFVEKQKWYRAPWIAAEFNLLYRWHGLVPDKFKVNGGDERFRRNYELLTKEGLGLGCLLDAATKQAAGKISLKNTPDFLIGAEQAMIQKGRDWRLRSFNDYREKFGLCRLTSFGQLTKDEGLKEELEKVYNGDIDNLEFTVGLFAEEGSRSLTGELQTRMVAYDAITQIYTNPLLAKENYTEKHFTQCGLDWINDIESFQTLVNRNVVDRFTKEPPTVSFTHPGASTASPTCWRLTRKPRR